MEALSTINSLPSSKKQVASFVYELKTAILKSKNPLEEFVKLKYAEKTFEEILKDAEIEKAVLEEFHLYEAEKIVEVLGAKLNISETGTKYDYGDCGDVVWNDLDKQIKELTEKKKARETFLKVLPNGGMVDPDNGNFINRPPKESKCRSYSLPYSVRSY